MTSKRAGKPTVPQQRAVPARMLPDKPPVPRRRVDGKYVVRWRYRLKDADGKSVEHRPKKIFNTRAEATDFILANLVAVSGTSPSSQTRTFFDASESWLESRRRKGLKPRTIEGYRDALTHARTFFDGCRIGDIRPADADDFMTWLSNSRPKLRTPRSVHWAWMPFAATMKHAVSRRELLASPAIGVELPRLTSPAQLSERVHSFLRPAEVARLCAALADRPPYDLLVRFAAYTGLRRGEVARLAIRHIALSAPTGARAGWSGSVRVDGDVKSASSRRTVPLPGWLADQIAAYLVEHPRRDEPGAPLWPNRRNGGYTHGARTSTADPHGALDWSSGVEPAAFYRNLFKPAVERAGLPPHLRFHDLRHTYASLLAAEGRSPAVVAKLLGHRDASITLRVYTHLWPEQLDAAVSALAEPPAIPPAIPTAATVPANVVPLHKRAG
jgi:integrase